MHRNRVNEISEVFSFFLFFFLGWEKSAPRDDVPRSKGALQAEENAF
jgi:hypothetical protein